jgi:hypothetical protein
MTRHPSCVLSTRQLNRAGLFCAVNCGPLAACVSAAGISLLVQPSVNQWLGVMWCSVCHDAWGLLSIGHEVGWGFPRQGMDSACGGHEAAQCDCQLFGYRKGRHWALICRRCAKGDFGACCCLL